MSLKAELCILLAELEQLDREHGFVLQRAEAHRAGALQGGILDMMLYSGAVRRLAEIEARALVIENRVGAIERLLVG